VRTLLGAHPSLALRGLLAEALVQAREEADAHGVLETMVAERTDQVRAWMAETPALALYRFALEELYRQQEHVLDDKGEHLLSLASRFENTPNDAYSALSTADAQFPVVRLSDGSEVTLTYGQYRAILSTNRNQQDRADAFLAFHRLYEANANTYASLYNGVI